MQKPWRGRTGYSDRLIAQNRQPWMGRHFLPQVTGDDRERCGLNMLMVILSKSIYLFENTMVTKNTWRMKILVYKFLHLPSAGKIYFNLI